MFCLYTSSKLSRPYFEFPLMVKVMGSNAGYLLKSFLLYHHILVDYFSLTHSHTIISWLIMSLSPTLIPSYLIDYFPFTYSHFSGMHGGPSHGPPGMMLNRPQMPGQAPTMPGKVQSTIKTNIKAGAQVHPYQRS